MFDSSSGYYPNNRFTLEKDVNSYLEKGRDIGLTPKLVLSPLGSLSECGTVYGRLFSAIDFSEFNNVILIGPSPVDTGPKLSFVDEDFKTPFGSVETDNGFTTRLDLSDTFEKREDLVHIPFVEIQLIFLQKVMEDFKIVPIIVNDSIGDEKFSEGLNLISKVSTSNDLIISCSNLAKGSLSKKDVQSRDSRLLNCLRSKKIEDFEELAKEYSVEGFKSVKMGLKIIQEYENVHTLGHNVYTADKVLNPKTEGFGGICFT